MGVGGIQHHIGHGDMGRSFCQLLFHSFLHDGQDAGHIAGNEHHGVLTLTAIDAQRGDHNGIQNATGNAQVHLSVDVYGLGGGNIPLCPADLHSAHASSSAFNSFKTAS